MNLDLIAPAFVGEQRLVLTLRDLDVRPRVGIIIVVGIDYGACDPQGVVMPLVYTVSQPDGAKLVSRVYNRIPPAVVDFVPESSGAHVVRIGEAFHNRWWGSLQVDVLGDELEA